ncbi:uncharacterized protein LOC133337441 [Musca vetustissima]|uniref:uncharacterized protein LOC133337441 n=1 Tax=Musca vetustissima TaxID=27455 RepID=UPI002AB7B020|nr:uncharacterized protein LOC133337441 [Musca vetustissima]
MECEFLLNIDNKEILIEILNQSIDFLIGNKDEHALMRQSHKYGFHNPDDFLLATRNMAKYYRKICCSGSGVVDHSMLPPDLKNIITSVYVSRREELLRFLIREQNASVCESVESFDWDVRLILGDSNFETNLRLLTNITFRLCNGLANKNVKCNYLQFQVNEDKVDELISSIELALSND